MLKEFFMRKMMEKQLKNVPKDQQEKIMAMLEKNPDFFTKIAGEVEAKVKGGKDQMAATMEVMKQHQEELKGMMQ